MNLDTLFANDIDCSHLFASLDQLVVPVIITDAALDKPGPRILYVNRALCEMTGYTPDELLDKTPRIFQGPKTNYGMLEELKKKLASGLAFEGRTVNYKKNGTPYHVEWSISPIRDQAGTVRYFISMQKDITAKVLLDEKRERILKEQAKLSTIGEMIEGSLHQWKAPVHAIHLILEFIQNALESSDPLDRQEMLEMLQQGILQVEFMDKTMNSFRLLTKLDDRKILFDVTESVTLLTSLFRRYFEMNDIAIELGGISGERYLYGNKNELQQILLSLMSNSKEAFEKRRSEPPKKITITLGEEADQIVIDYRDNAGGIPESVLPRIFEPRFTTKGEKGSGIGLSLAKMFVDAFGGTITVENLDGGARFVLRLPKKNLNKEVLHEVHSVYRGL